MATAFDTAWQTRALAGEPQAVDSLVDEVMGPLYRFCYYRVGRDRDLCQEVVHETLARAIRELDRYEPARADHKILPWMVGLARNEIRRALARSSKQATTSLDVLWERMDRELLAVYERLEQEPFSDEQIRRDETRELVNATMSQLPEHYREALEAKYVDGQSVRSMADGFGLSERAAESRLARARKAFRATFLTLVKNLQHHPELIWETP